MDRVPKLKEVSVRVPKILGQKDGDPYPNRKLSSTRYRVSNNFSSGFLLPNNPIITNFLFFAKKFCSAIFFLDSFLVDCYNFLT